VRRAWILAALILAAGCSAKTPSPESVVRAWSEELNSGDNESAAALFAPGARVIQGGRTLTLRTRKEAVAWNAGLPCSGRIVAIMTRSDTAVATFRLGDRGTVRCDSPGGEATALFRVRKGKIVLWHQTGSSDGPAETVQARPKRQPAAGTPA
jgi:hypothetical protein